MPTEQVALQQLPADCILILVLPTERSGAQSEAGTIEIFAVKIIRIPDQTNDLAIGHARDLSRCSERRVVQNALSKSPSHPSLQGLRPHVCGDSG
jgi:hypothetical protein